jgi:hypothetical protein
MHPVDWDEIVNLHSSADVDTGLIPTRHVVIGGDWRMSAPLARAVQIVMENWSDNPPAQEAAWIAFDSGHDMEFEEIAQLYLRPDFPRQVPKE